MKRLTTHLFALLLLVSGSLAFAAATTKTYSGFYDGVACTVQMKWSNWSGLGPIEGQIKLANGTLIPFSGSNSRPGVLEFRANQTPFRLVRKDGGRTTSWVSARLSFSEGAAPTPTPSPTPSPSPTPIPESTESTMVEEHYTGTWKGKPFTAQMRWAPGDTPEVIRRGRGTVTLEDGTQFSVEGWQPNADAAEFTFAPDESGETYKTTRATGEGAVTWESSSLTLTEKK